MPIPITCPAGHTIYVDDSRAGEAVACPWCAAADKILLATAETWPSRSPTPQTAAGTGEIPNRNTGIKSRPPGKPLALPAGVVEPAAGKVRLVRLLAAGLALAVAMSLTPIVWLQQWNMATAPGWARLVVLTATLQAAFIAWMLTAPDWASVRVVMLVFAAGASLYGAGLAAALTTPLDHPMLLGLGAVRHDCAAWCGVMLVLMSLAAWLSARLSALLRCPS